MDTNLFKHASFNNFWCMLHFIRHLDELIQYIHFRYFIPYKVSPTIDKHILLKY